MKTLQVTNSNGISFKVQLIEKGMSWGRTNSNVHEENEPIVLFFDITSSKDDTYNLVSYYYRYTIMEIQNRGLCLDGGFPQTWFVTAENIKEIQNWLVNIANLAESN